MLNATVTKVGHKRKFNGVEIRKVGLKPITYEVNVIILFY